MAGTNAVNTSTLDTRQCYLHDSTVSLGSDGTFSESINERTPILKDLSEEHHDRKGTLFSSIFTLVSTMIGGGLLSLPFAFEQGGFAVASLVLIFVLVASTHGGFLIINSKKYCQGQLKNIEDVAMVAFGRKGQIAVQILLICILFLCSVAYYILTADQIEPIIEYAMGARSMWTKRIVVLTIVLAIVFPISLMRNLSALRFTSGFGVLCACILCGCIIFRSSSVDIGGSVTRPDNPVKWYPKSLGQFLTCVSISQLTFSCHFNIMPMHGELRHQTRRNKRIILCSAMGVTYVVNFLVSFFGYMQFRKYTDQDITKNYRHDDIAVTIGRAGLGALLLLSYPLLIVPCRATINKMIWNPTRTINWLEEEESSCVRFVSNRAGNDPSRPVWFLETFLIVFSGYALAYVVPQVNMVWGLVGAVGCTAIIYILPPAFYLKVRHHPSKPDLKQVSAALLLACGIVVLLAGVYQSVMNIVYPIDIIRPLEKLSGNSTHSNVTSHAVSRTMPYVL